MSEIIEFPTQQVRNWAVIEGALLPILRKADMQQDAQDELLERMKSFTELLQMQFAFSIPAGCPAEVNSEIDRFTIKGARVELNADQWPNFTLQGTLRDKAAQRP